MQHTQHAADDRLRGERRRVPSSRRAFVIEHQRETIEHLTATRQHDRPRLRRTHHAIPRERRLLIEELEHRHQRRTDPVGPAILAVEGHARAFGGKRQRLLKRRQQGRFSTIEMLVKCLT